jgi:hypothetical protein
MIYNAATNSTTACVISVAKIRRRDESQTRIPNRTKSGVRFGTKNSNSHLHTQLEMEPVVGFAL